VDLLDFLDKPTFYMKPFAARATNIQATKCYEPTTDRCPDLSVCSIVSRLRSAVTVLGLMVVCAE